MCRADCRSLQVQLEKSELEFIGKEELLMISSKGCHLCCVLESPGYDGELKTGRRQRRLVPQCRHEMGIS
jgi:hypothetical protein